VEGWGGGGGGGGVGRSLRVGGGDLGGGLGDGGWAGFGGGVGGWVVGGWGGGMRWGNGHGLGVLVALGKEGFRLLSRTSRSYWGGGGRGVGCIGSLRGG